MLKNELKQEKSLKSKDANLDVKEKNVNVDIQVLDKIIRGKFCQLTLQIGQILHDQSDKKQVEEALNEVYDTVEALKETTTEEEMLYDHDPEASVEDNPLQQLVNEVRAAPTTGKHKKLYLLYKKLYHDAENVGVSLNVLANSDILTKAAVETCSIKEIQGFIDELEKKEEVELMHQFAENLEENMDEEDFTKLKIPEFKKEPVDETDEVMTVDQIDDDDDDDEEEEAAAVIKEETPEEPLQEEQKEEQKEEEEEEKGEEEDNKE
eukprot:CAMPEP_0117426004 /NCGR_PEP_ID=MMETSP0758-20121206/6191_1 /TAXON_ID=63605 /ORGANISM="Percolomonas cosmopolitus, Strain AE-1 (ATCC 50343)" /LENGTH=264 /DNA_ID=CAMNT_0005210885 /DNA_START=148 /DNA_END=942 /DNA_ORIENTATION=-